MIKNLILPQKEPSITVEEMLSTFKKIRHILVYSGESLRGFIFKDYNDWYYIPNCDFINRECYASLDCLLRGINVNNLNVKVIYYE